VTDREKQDLISALKAWAVHHPEIARVIVYGSRARGDHRPESDLDVAVELEESQWQESPFTIWMTSGTRWQRELAPLLPWALDLQWHDRGDETPTVSAKIQRGHFVVYERSR
jgi:predicted nucleotidyltransferase